MTPPLIILDTKAITDQWVDDVYQIGAEVKRDSAQNLTVTYGSLVGVLAESREALIKWAYTGLKDGSMPDVFLAIDLSCGHRVSYRKPGDIPTDNVPCSCGDPTHWFIWYNQISDAIDKPIGDEVVSGLGATT